MANFIRLYIDKKMKINKDNWIFLILNVFMVFGSLVIGNLVVERLIKQPFKNSLND